MKAYAYPLSDGTAIAKIRKARKQYRCPAVWAHDPVIKPGEFYARVKLTPGMGCGWREETYHLDCTDTPLPSTTPKEDQ